MVPLFHDQIFARSPAHLPGDLEIAPNKISHAAEAPVRRMSKIGQDKAANKNAVFSCVQFNTFVPLFLEGLFLFYQLQYYSRNSAGQVSLFLAPAPTRIPNAFGRRNSGSHTCTTLTQMDICEVCFLIPRLLKPQPWFVSPRTNFKYA